MISIKKTLMIAITLSLILIVGFRPLEYFLDTDNYLIMIQNNKEIFQQEPTFWLINKFNQMLLGGNNQIFFLLYAILGVSLKILAIKRYSLAPLLSVYIYVCIYILLHEMTQIRIGVASGLLLLSLKDIRDKNFFQYLMKTIFATLFHYSAVIMLPLYFLSAKKLNRKIYFFLPVIGFLLFLFKDSVLIVIEQISTYFPSFISEKITTYLFLLRQGVFTDLNLFNTYYLSIITIYYFALFNSKKLQSSYDFILIKIQCLSITAFSSLAALPVLSFRISEFLGIVIIILLANLTAIFKQKYIIHTLIIIWSSLYFQHLIKTITMLL